VNDGTLPAAPDCIPANLRGKLEAMRGSLEVQGVVQLHGGRNRQHFYRLRYREADPTGTLLHRSLSLGPDIQLAAAVRDLISTWKAERLKREADQRRQAAAVKLDNMKTALACSVAQAIAGGGRRRRKQIRDWFNATLQDPQAMTAFSISNTLPEARKPGGQHKCALW